MKIAIQGHSTRDKEVIQLLESLGGINSLKQTGKCIGCAYYVDTVGIISSFGTCRHCGNRKIYTLEEFEKEFPFKIGDKVRHISSIGTIRKYCYIDNKPGYEVESMELGIIANIPAEILEPYKEMKEERNITLTLDKAKEWFKKGGELKEVALQAFSEKELTKVDLPKTWEEFCRTHDIMPTEALITSKDSDIQCLKMRVRREVQEDRNMCPSRASAEAHLAMMQLEQLRNCWRQGWVQTPTDAGYRINKTLTGDYVVMSVGSCKYFLSFPTKEMAEEFLECFRDLIEKAGDLI